MPRAVTDHDLDDSESAVPSRLGSGAVLAPAELAARRPDVRFGTYSVYEDLKDAAPFGRTCRHFALRIWVRLIDKATPTSRPLSL